MSVFDESLEQFSLVSLLIFLFFLTHFLLPTLHTLMTRFLTLFCDLAGERERKKLAIISSKNVTLKCSLESYHWHDHFAVVWATGLIHDDSLDRLPFSLSMY